MPSTFPTVVRGPVANPGPDGSVTYTPDGALAADSGGRLTFVGAWDDFARAHGPGVPHARVRGLIVPGMFDLHTHVPQHPIRGHFSDHVDPNDGRGVLLASLEKNVFPAERTWEDAPHAAAVAAAFVDDTRRRGVVGGCAFLTIHVAAAERVMDALPPTWHAGLVLMDQHCPAYLQNDERAIDDTRRLAEQFGNRYVVTDRFAVANSSRQRRAAAAIAGRLGLMTQTHLNEQVMEKRFVEDVLYPHSASYTHVYGDDGLLDTRAMVAHCVQMTPPEWRLLAEKRAVVAHCPTSNARLGSGVMDLDALIAHGIDYAVCTDVGASGTTSLLAEMANFLLVHRGRSRGATACEALYRTTLAPARVLGSDDRFGHFAVGKQLCFVELATSPVGATDAESVLQNALLPPTLLAQLPAAMTRPGGTTVAEILLHAAATNDILAQHEAGVRQVVGMPA